MKADIDGVLQSLKSGSPDISELNRIFEDLKANQVELETLLNDTYDQQDEFRTLQKERGDFTIPVNIRHRQNNMEAFSERLDRINDEFAELRQADNDFEGEAAVE